MAKLIALTLLTHNNFWIAETFAANSSILANAGIDVLSADPIKINMYGILNHTRLWTDPDREKARLEEIKKGLDGGRSQLIINVYSSLATHENFVAALSDNGIQPEDIENFIIAGRPAMFYETSALSVYPSFSQAIEWQVRQNISHFPTVARLYQNELPSGHVHVIPDLSTLSLRFAALDITDQIFQILGAGKPQKASMPCFRRQFFNTPTAIRLPGISKAAGNIWPKMDVKPYLEAILSLDEKIAPQPAAPLAMRQAFLNNPDMIKLQDRLEDLCNLEEGALAAPCWFGSLPELKPDEALPGGAVTNFAASLPGGMQKTLLERFVNDKNLLTPDQKLLANALAMEQKGLEFSRLETGGEEPVLTVLTMTYNHEKYIAQCMESVLAQKTDFPVRHLVLDHCSTDSTPDIVAEYAARYPSIRPVLLDKRTPQENVRGLFSRCHSEYAALCDGDDYFTAPHKLQKQVDFLKANPHCGLVFHPVRVVFENGERESFFYPPIQSLPRGMKKEYYLSDLTRGNLIQTNSVVYRWRFRDGLPDWFRADLCPGDWYWHMLHAELGKIGFIPEVMSVYRRHSGALYSHAFLNSVEHSRDTGMKSLEAYHIYNEHFKNRYFKNFANLAAGVFSDFVAIANSEGDTTLLDDAAKEYPEFGRHFLELARKLENSPGSNEKA